MGRGLARRTRQEKGPCARRAGLQFDALGGPLAAGDERRKSAFVLARIRRVQRRLNLETALNAAVVPAWVAVTLLAVWRFVVQRQVAWVAAALFLGAAIAWRLLARRKGV